MQANKMKARFAAGEPAFGDTLAKIVAAGRTPGMPYIYTHLPTVLGAGGKAYFKNARG